MGGEPGVGDEVAEKATLQEVCTKLIFSVDARV
jgi:hypothetical protein